MALFGCTIEPEIHVDNLKTARDFIDIRNGGSNDNVDK